MAPATVAPSRLRVIAPIIAGPLAALLVHALTPALDPPARSAAAVTAWMALWWITEALPLGATALVPLVAFPLLGVMPAKDAAAPYADRIIFLFLGGFLLALAMERWNLHRRIALHAVLLVGTSPARLVAGVMLATALLSMWVSNTATALMMLPLATSLIALLTPTAEARTPDADNFAKAILLAIAYAASIGGVATPIGSPPNAIVIAFLRETFNYDIPFLRWVVVAAPFAAVFLVIAWLYLVRLAFPLRATASRDAADTLRNELARLGPLSRAEAAVMAVFFLTVTGWLGRQPLAWAFPTLKTLLTERIDDTTVALIGGLLLFVIPVEPRRRLFVMDWPTAARIPWEVLLLFGGGLSLAAGVQASGLDDDIARSLALANAWPTLIILLALLAASVFLSEFTSNTAQANLMMPILASLAVAAAIDPVFIIMPCGIALSCAFMMPMGTPPNAIVFGSGRLAIRDMARAGLALNLVGIALALAAAYTLIAWLMPPLNPAP